MFWAGGRSRASRRDPVTVGKRVRKLDAAAAAAAAEGAAVRDSQAVATRWWAGSRPCEGEPDAVMPCKWGGCWRIVCCRGGGANLAPRQQENPAASAVIRCKVPGKSLRHFWCGAEASRDVSPRSLRIQGAVRHQSRLAKPAQQRRRGKSIMRACGARWRAARCERCAVHRDASQSGARRAGMHGNAGPRPHASPHGRLIRLRLNANTCTEAQLTRVGVPPPRA